ncbi:THY1 Predicted alternative thymidylate synthase [uncultured Caudovirales phage]|uniref:THY1 Predicted alternative thymidylate synthase n=1 Tax=uncultured Caudovirales phage TaxID=2100421 RepID=A0A6J5MA31_9CAUD|nr:THY1 Predicted alternative thymidylate synthase [uncultured Caudovirales phage]
MMSEVNLVAISKPSAYTGCTTANELVAWAARVSNPSNQSNTKTAPKLVQYLIRENHWSPLEMVHVSMEIKTTRDIARQILRHRSFAFQEYSQRYADPTKDLGFVTREARLQDAKNRQNSIEVEDARLAEEWNMMQMQVINASKMAYNWAVENGIAKEQRRAVLPEGNTESVMIMAGSLRSWVHYCQLRMDKATQKEHRIVAEQCWEIIMHHFPDVQKALETN